MMGYAWIRGKQYFFLAAREILRGKHKGKYELTMPVWYRGRNRYPIVKKESIIEWIDEDNDKHIIVNN